MRVLYLVDSKDYIDNNCFQHQLHSAFCRQADVRLFEINKPYMTWRAKLLRLNSFDAIVSVLRQRTFNRLLPVMKSIFGERQIKVYEQDPWESYIDGGACLGFYHRLRDSMNAKVFVTSRWWSDKLRKDNLDADWVRMGIEPRYCDVGPAYHARPIEIGFRGAFHPHRVKAFDEMGAAGISIQFEKTRVDYDGFMQYLHKVKIFTHDESGHWPCSDGDIARSTGIHVKDIEVASRGTFVLRNTCPDDCGYEFDKVPTIIFYDKPGNAMNTLEVLRKRSLEETLNMQLAAVKEIKSRDDWFVSARKILEA